jgi:hypothetical protein
MRRASHAHAFEPGHDLVAEVRQLVGIIDEGYADAWVPPLLVARAFSMIVYEWGRLAKPTVQRHEKMERASLAQSAGTNQ